MDIGNKNKLAHYGICQKHLYNGAAFMPMTECYVDVCKSL